MPSVQDKLFGQVQLTRRALEHLSDGGSIVLTSRQIPEATPGSAGGALVKAALEAFVRAAAVEMRGLRLNVVSPGWVRESLGEARHGRIERTPVTAVARAYLQALAGTAQAETFHPGR